MREDRFIIEVQTRDQEGSLQYFPRVDEAIKFAETNSSVWKISFSISSGERIRLVREWVEYPTKSNWIFESMQEAIDDLFRQRGFKVR